MTTKEEILDTYLNFDFQGERKRRLEERAAKRKAMEENFEKGHQAEGTHCMRCPEPRWIHPDSGETVLCKEHLYGYIYLDEDAPPLRRGRDYQSMGRKTFLVEQLPGSELPIIDKDPQ